MKFTGEVHRRGRRTELQRAQSGLLSSALLGAACGHLLGPLETVASSVDLDDSCPMDETVDEGGDARCWVVVKAELIIPAAHVGGYSWISSELINARASTSSQARFAEKMMVIERPLGMSRNVWKS